VTSFIKTATRGEGKRERYDRSVGRQGREGQSRPTKGINADGQTGRAAARKVNTLRHRWGDGASDHDTASNTFTPTEIDTQVDGAHEERTVSIQQYARAHTRTNSNRTMACAGRQACIGYTRQALAHSCHSHAERKRYDRSVPVERRYI